MVGNMSHIGSPPLVPPKGGWLIGLIGLIGHIGLIGLISLISLMGEPYGTPPLGRGWGWVGNMAHIGR